MGGVEIEVSISPELRDLASKLRRGREFIAAELQTAFKELAQEGKDNVAAAARQKLPRAGGLGDIIAWAGCKASVNATGVRFSISEKLAAFDAGQFRHPVFGDMSNLVYQTVPSGYFSDTLDAMKSDIDTRLARAVRSAETELQGAIA